MNLNKSLRSWRVGLLASVLLLATSCDQVYRTNYLRDMEVAKTYGVKYDMGLTIQKGDKLSILVSSIRNPELTIPFNPPQQTTTTAKTPSGKRITAPVSNVSQFPTVNFPEGVTPTPSPAAQIAYLVDAEGCIQFPLLGSVKVTGMTLDQVSEYLRTRLVSEKYLMDAHVTTTFDNLRVYLLGALGVHDKDRFNNNEFPNKGVFHLDDPQTNILELVAQAGGLMEQANYERLNIIRKEPKGYVIYRVNLLSSGLFESPAFILRQNDIVYAEYKYRRDADQRTSQALTYTSTIVSSLVSLLAIVTFFKK